LKTLPFTFLAHLFSAAFLPIDRVEIQNKEMLMNMNCSNCPDREICYKSGNNTENPRDAKYREAYMRALRCRRQRFG